MKTRPGYSRLLVPPKQSFFLFGMRGVGKSTWARKEFPQAVRFDLLDEGLYQSYLREPRLRPRLWFAIFQASRVFFPWRRCFTGRY